MNSNSFTPKKQSPSKNKFDLDKDLDQEDYSYGSSFWKNAKKDKIDSSPYSEPLIVVDFDVKNMFDYSKHSDIETKNNYLEKIVDNIEKESVSVAQLLKKIKKPEVVNTFVSGKKVFFVFTRFTNKVV